MKRIIFLITCLMIWMCSPPFVHSVKGEGFERFHMPVSNPIFDGDPRNVTMIRPIFLYQKLPDKIEPSPGVKALLKAKGLGDKVPLGGHVKGYALQLSYAFNDRFSFVAVKDGFVQCRPDGGAFEWHDHDGWADLAAGFQYSFLYRPDKDFIMTGRAVIELPTGSGKVFQGNGDGDFIPSVLFLKGFGKLQLNGVLGFVFPFDTKEENTLFYNAWHVSYAVTDWFRPLIELNHFHVISSGDRDLVDALGQDTVNALPGLDAETIVKALHEVSKTSAWDDTVAAVATFNGCDIINLGGADSDQNRNLVTIAFGARFRLLKWLDMGITYEFPLTDDEKGLIKNRLTVDSMITIHF